MNHNCIKACEYRAISGLKFVFSPMLILHSGQWVISGREKQASQKICPETEDS
jgi:hypothetical protein